MKSFKGIGYECVCHVSAVILTGLFAPIMWRYNLNAMGEGREMHWITVELNETTDVIVYSSSWTKQNMMNLCQHILLMLKLSLA